VDPTESNSNGSTEPDITEINPNDRVVVPAVAGSNPVAHPSKVPANRDFSREPDRSVLRDRDRSGTDASATTTGTPAESEADEPPIRFRGDGADLYLEHNHEHRGRRGARLDPVPALPAGSPARWKGWLFRTAQREAWRLNAVRRRDVRIVSDIGERRPGEAREPADPRNGIEDRVEFLAAMDEVKRLPKRMRQVVVVRSQVARHKDVADILGISTGRVGYLLATVGNTLRQLDEQRAERERPVASPRAARLRELEEHTPGWLIEAIGRLPTRGKNASATVLAWRRAALAIDDYRRDHGWTSADKGPATCRRVAHTTAPSARRSSCAMSAFAKAAGPATDERLDRRCRRTEVRSSKPTTGDMTHDGAAIPRASPRAAAERAGRARDAPRSTSSLL
jgi:hypothetical protein